MSEKQRVNILLVDDQMGKLLSYEAILTSIDENLIKASSAREAFEHLLRNEIAVILVDVCMPELDGFQLAEMIREHPRFKKTAIIFISAIQLEDVDRLRGYEMGAVDYVPVPVVPAVLQAKVRVFAELFRKTRALEELNTELERRVLDRTAELNASMERQTMLAREVDHRAKNTLAVVQSIVRLTQASTIEQYKTTVNGRIQALSRVHTILANSRWESAELTDLVTKELTPFRSEENSWRVVANGPPVQMRPAMAQSLALALHELATNAAKYGALSTASGTLVLSWKVSGDYLCLDWIEAGGPPARAPQTRGFGTMIMSSAIEGQMSGRVTFAWRNEGLHCSILVPGFGPQMSDHDGGVVVPIMSANTEPMPHAVRPVGAGRTTLVVEDEALVGLALQEILEQSGRRVLGPVANVAKAVEAVRAGKFDEAVLDVNVGDETVYPVAEELRRSGIPFVFVTGYGASAIDRRFSDVAVIEKPIESEVLVKTLDSFAEREMHRTRLREQINSIA